MAEHRFYLGDGPLAAAGSGDELQLSGDPAHRISRVLRLRASERIALFGDGREFEAVLTNAGRSPVVRLLEPAPPDERRPSLTLYQALIRPNRFEWLIEKGTEIGVTRFVPIVTERTAVRATEIGAARLERWRRIAVEATEQCGRRQPPSIAPPTDYASALAAAEGIRVFAWEGLRSGAEERADKPPAEPNVHYSLFVGPEGGWTAGEAEAARAAGAVFLRLGPTILRAETAAIVAAALLLLA